MSDRIRSLRESLQLTQSELAQRSGVTRQLISALEAGRHTPNVSAALALAAALGVSVEVLFGSASAAATDVFDDRLAQGTTVATAQVGEQIISIPHRHGIHTVESWELGDAVVERSGLSWLPGGSTDGFVIAGCDPILGLLAGMVQRTTAQRILTVHASTGRSLAALAAGRVHGVLVHSPAAELPTPPVLVSRWHVSRWLVGLAASGHGPPTIEQLAEGHNQVVQREPGAGSQRALERALRAVGSQDALPGPVAEGHVDVARRIAQGAGHVGITMEPAARAFGLEFLALEEHAVELWIDARWVNLVAAKALVSVLGSPGLTQRMTQLAGYDLASCGNERIAG
jgi:transcriptional regulator with XRE-family HTH domain/molybdate-binding protein